MFCRDAALDIVCRIVFLSPALLWTEHMLYEWKAHTCSSFESEPTLLVADREVLWANVTDLRKLSQGYWKERLSPVSESLIAPENSDSRMMIQIIESYAKEGVRCIGINSNIQGRWKDPLWEILRITREWKDSEKTNRCIYW